MRSREYAYATRIYIQIVRTKITTHTFLTTKNRPNFLTTKNHPYHETHRTKITTRKFLTTYTKSGICVCNMHLYIDCANQNNHTHISYHQNFLITKNGPLCEPTKTHLPCMRTIKNTLTTYARMRTKITNQKLLPRKSKFSRFLKIYRKMSFEQFGNLSKIHLS